MLLTSKRLSQNFENILIIAVTQFSMLFCMLLAIIYTDSYENHFVDSREVLAVKFPCTIALHLYLYPEVTKGMQIMKFANNQHKLFYDYGSNISFLIGMI